MNKHKITLGLSNKPEVNKRIEDAVGKGFLYWDNKEKVYKLTAAGKIDFTKELVKELKKKGG